MRSVNCSIGQNVAPTLTATSKTNVKVTIGGKGFYPGKFSEPRGVAVSSEEIFVSDMKNKRVQVFSMSGVYLRFFPTILLGKNGEAMFPTDVAIDGEGLVWVVGRPYVGEDVLFVVQYDPNGVPVTKVDVQCWAWYPNIAVDANNNKIVVETSDEIWIFLTNSSFERRFGKDQELEIDYVTTNKDGDVLVTDYTSRGVYVYTNSGNLRFRFGGRGSAEAQFRFPRGICTDRFGNILVANQGNGRVDMFTSRGKFVRSVVKINNPFGIALGPDGQLVVTNVYRHSITIFPSHMVYP
ncbi:tripartite motif-containing protein 3-like [Branchiostoma floridae]|uniref:Tripartite motif-containing protein 3-like n=1 Tax=Branchiostoma floridae TaxID=7739 RepID=A0A9J7KFX9_BRAFL|nr:tripartite motif-containing protein 3-like [Branchiostoma floridae]